MNSALAGLLLVFTITMVKTIVFAIVIIIIIIIIICVAKNFGIFWRKFIATYIRVPELDWPSLGDLDLFFKVTGHFKVEILEFLKWNIS